MLKKFLRLAVIAFWLVSCTDAVADKTIAEKSYGEINVDAALIERDFLQWWTYFNEDIQLSADFVPLDTALKVMSKEAFLEALTTGNYLPVKLTSKDDNTYLQLYPITKNADNEIAQVIKDKAEVYLQQFNMEGAAFPDFDYVSLDGTTFNNGNTKGKLLIIKCWFVACQACIEEMPELNQLVAENEGRDDVAFISFAYDPPEALEKFMANREFNYHVLPTSRAFIANELQVFAYPTHFIVDQDGIIRKVVNTYEELEMALQQLI